MPLAVISLSRTLFGLAAARQISVCASLSLLSLLPFRNGHAESVEYQGRAFKVDSVKEIDGSNVVIEINGQRLVTSRSAAGALIFKLYAQKPNLLDREEGLQGYGAWVATLESKGDASDAVMAAQGMATSRTIDSRRKFGFYDELVASPEGEKALFRAISSIQQGDGAACGAVAFLGADSQRVLKDIVLRERNWMTRECPQALVATAQEMMSAGKPTWGVAMLRAAATVFSGMGGVADAATTSLKRIDEVHQALRSRGASQFDSALKLATFDALLSDYFEKRQPELITEFSSEALREGRPASALRGLALLNFSFRNNIHHELVSKALSQLTFEDRAILRQSEARKLLWLYATKDDVVRQQYLSMLDEWARRSLDDNRPTEALESFELIRELRLDPSLENDTLRRYIAESFVNNGDDASAEALLREIRTELPWSYRFRLLLKRDVYMFTMVALGVGVLLRWALILVGMARKQNTARRVAREAERRAAEAAEHERLRSQFGSDTLRAEGFMDVDEYAAGLKKFRLRPSCSLADIKDAYRHVVKKLHPDLNPGATKEDTDTFIDLTRTYERLLILHADRERRTTPSK